MKDLEIKPLAIAEIFDRCFSLLGSAYRTLFVTGAAIILPVSVVVWLLFRQFFAFLSQFAGTLEETDIPDAAILYEMSQAFGGVALGAILLVVAETLLFTAFVLILSGRVVGRSYDAGEALSLTFSMRGIKTVIQRWLGEFACMMVITFPYIVFMAAVGTRAGGAVIFLTVMLIVMSFFAMLYLRVRWAFGVIAISWEESGIIEAFGRSSELVRSNGWRVFGIMALFSILTAFAVNLVMTPVQFFVLWDIFRAYMTMITEVMSGTTEPDPTPILIALKGMGPGLAILIGINLLLTSIIKSIYLTVIYFDLRARHAEFESDTTI